MRKKLVIKDNRMQESLGAEQENQLLKSNEIASNDTTNDTTNDISSWYL